MAKELFPPRLQQVQQDAEDKGVDLFNPSLSTNECYNIIKAAAAEAEKPESAILLPHERPKKKALAQQQKQEGKRMSETLEEHRRKLPKLSSFLEEGNRGILNSPKTDRFKKDFEAIDKKLGLDKRD